ncbi:unnamed protein product [Thelazia callipaeda]|uniref:F-box domain-containing protein n=1 Tax=Thelazia callipaeda TaxID=103827 RepID=A0A0N5D643_THECL|nr:unnamed protein product [Thelazia callipaeda]
MDAITDSPGKYWPVSRKYDRINRNYKFPKKPCPFRMKKYYPVIRTSDPDTKRRLAAMCDYYPKVDLHARSDQGMRTVINDLPDDVFLIIFQYFHPIQLIQSISLVCHRWHYLANNPILFTEVRILIDGVSIPSGCAKNFLQKISNHAKKICLISSFTSPSSQIDQLFDLCLPKVTYLDLTSLFDLEMNFALLKKISTCFPNVETLHFNKNSLLEEYDGILKMIFEDNKIFPKLLNFFIYNDDRSFSDNSALYSPCCRPLNMLNLISLFSLKKRKNYFPSKLKCLTLRSFPMLQTSFLDCIDASCPELRALDIAGSKLDHEKILFHIITCFRNLMYLNLSDLGSAYTNKVWWKLGKSEDKLPKLRFLKLHNNEICMKALMTLNLKRPKLLITVEKLSIINWTLTGNDITFHKQFDGDLNALECDLCQINELRAGFMTSALPYLLK